MSVTQNNPQLPPTRSIQTDDSLRATTEHWFEYLIKVHPHHTDYGGLVWHGHYLTWMEEARVECLRSIGIEYADLVNSGCELPVVELALKYHQPLNMGMSAVVKTRMSDIQGVRIHWDYQIESLIEQKLFVSGRVTLVGIDRDKKKIMRQLPPVLKDALVKL